MTPESLGDPAAELPPSAEERFHRTRAHCNFQAEHAPDEYMRAFYANFNDRLGMPGVIRDSLQELLAIQPNLEPAVAANRLLRAVQALEQSVDKTYPAGRDQPEGWDATFDRIEEDDDYYGAFFVNTTRNVQSNIADRGKLLKAVALLNNKTEWINVLDVGCSQNHILKKLALLNRKGYYRYGQTEVMRRSSHGPEGKLERDNATTHKFNHLLEKVGLRLGLSIGVDDWDPNDLRVKGWARSCSFYPGEFRDPRLVNEFDRLTLEEPHNVSFHLADFANFDEEKFAHHFPNNQKFDVAYFSTVLYQTTVSEQKIMIENAKKHVKEDGLIVVQDFVDIKPGDSMEFDADWRNYAYACWVWHAARPEAGFQKYFTVESGRAKRLIIEPAAGKLALARYFQRAT